MLLGSGLVFDAGLLMAWLWTAATYNTTPVEQEFKLGHRIKVEFVRPVRPRTASPSLCKGRLG